MERGYGYNPYDNSVVKLIDWHKQKDAIILITTSDKSPLCFKKQYFSDFFTQTDFRGLICTGKPVKNAAEYVESKAVENMFYDVSKLKFTEEPTFVNLERLLTVLFDNNNKYKIRRLRVMKHPVNVAYWDVAENIIETSHALKRYSHQWDYPINIILRKGEKTFSDTKLFQPQFLQRYRFENDPETISRDIALKNIKTVINSIDNAFEESELIGKNVKGYRGMKNHFDELLEEPEKGLDSAMKPIGTSFIVKSYTSISTSVAQARRFMPKQKFCCLYEIKVDKNVPTINMINTTEYEYEKELLLPRNLLFRFAGTKRIKINGYLIEAIILQVSLVDPSMYNKPKPSNRCLERKKAVIYNIEDQEDIDDILAEPTNPDAPIVHAPKCPIHTNRNPSTGICVPNNAITPIQPSTKPTKPTKPEKCPKGTRKNKKTGKCEVYTKKTTKKPSPLPTPTPQPPTPQPTKVKPSCPPNMELQESSCTCIPIKRQRKTKSSTAKKKEAPKAKTPKCPKGTHRNKKTGLCEPIHK